MGTIARKGFSAVIALAVICFFTNSPAGAADRMFFGGISTLNPATGHIDVVIEWGALEGKIPAEIEEFRIYRKTSSSSYIMVEKIANQLASPSRIKDLFNEPGEEKQRKEIIDMLSETDPATTNSNYHTILHGILDPDSSDYNSLQKQFLTRYSRNAARARGRAHIDRNVPTDYLTYMLTGVLSDGSETTPLGRFTIDTTSETILSAPNNFEQVRIGSCSATRKNIDHARIHLNWRIPSAPELMSIRSLIYGYDIYRSDSNLGSLDLRTHIPSSCTRINEVPIIASGNAPDEGLGAFLAKDDGDVLKGGPGLEPGDTYYYYLVARDISGEYSDTAGPLEAVVPDTRPPAVPWNVHSQREETGTAPFSPRLTLMWDRVNNLNYLNHYGTGKTICESSPEKVCYVYSPANCEEAENPVCVDLEVVEYLVYRFDSFKKATEWGTDTDGDLWPDHLEDTNENDQVDTGETDPCDPASSLSGTPSPLVERIEQTDSSHVRTLESGKKMMFFQDPVPEPDNKVYWYRISTVDPSGNISPLSPPARASLWDRSQPKLNGKIIGQDCDYTTSFYPTDDKKCQNVCTGDKDVLALVDETGLATDFRLYEICEGRNGNFNRLVYSGPIKDKVCLTLGEEIDPKNCGQECNTGKYFVQFYGGTRFSVKSESFVTEEGLCNRVGCIILQKECTDVEITLDNPGYIPPISPNDPIQICATLKPGECTKVYQKIQDQYSPVLSFCNHEDTEMEVCDTVDIPGIVTMDVCLGLRIFSENHVGSGMGRFQCISKMAAPPQSPLIENVKKKGSQSDPSFELQWSSQSEGISAFTIQRKGDTGTYYETAWNLEPDPATGKFIYELSIDTGQVNEEWCFQVRAIGSALQMSEWSSQMCATWKQSESTVSLKWPHVDLPPEGNPLTAFFLKGENVGAVVLSDDVGPIIDELTTGDCDFQPQTCKNSNCLQNVIGCRCNVCGSIKSWNRYGRFVLYRQEENRNYIQISPLIKTIHCVSGNAIPQCDEIEGSLLDDPMIYLVHLEPGSGTVSGVGSAVINELEGTERLIFADWYPHKTGSKVRYHLMKIDGKSGEPEKVFTSDWITMN